MISDGIHNTIIFASSQGYDGFRQILRGDAARDVLNTRRVRSGHGGISAEKHGDLMGFLWELAM